MNSVSTATNSAPFCRRAEGGERAALGNQLHCEGYTPKRRPAEPLMAAAPAPSPAPPNNLADRLGACQRRPFAGPGLACDACRWRGQRPRASARSGSAAPKGNYWGASPRRRRGSEGNAAALRGWLDNGAGSCGFPAFKDWPPGFRPMHAYRTHTCGALRLLGGGADGASVRLGAPQARPWPAAVHRSARPLRHHPMRHRRVVAAVRGGRGAAAGKRRHRHRAGVAARGRDRQSQARRPAGSSWSSRLEVQSVAEPLPFPVNSEAEYPRGHAAALPLSRSAARTRARATSCCAPRSSPRSAGA